jgi:hypothetical protein
LERNQKRRRWSNLINVEIINRIAVSPVFLCSCLDGTFSYPGKVLFLSKNIL